MSLKLNWLAAVLLAAVTFAVACSGALATPIGDVMANPRDYEDKVITIACEVSGRMSLLKWKTFTLKDATGEIAVVTKRALPEVGTQLRVRGTAKDAFSIGSLQMIVLVEESDD